MAKSSLAPPPASPSYFSIFSDQHDDDDADDAIPTRSSFTIDHFRPQLIKMYFRMQAQDQERQTLSVSQPDTNAEEEQRQRELEDLVRQNRLIIIPSTPTDTPTEQEVVPSPTALTRTREDSAKKGKAREDFISIFDVVGK